jgi:hypothetical protein
MCAAEANERWSASNEAYRKEVAGKAYVSAMVSLCGEDGKGGDHEFPTLKRTAAKGGDWTWKQSVEMRPKETGSIYMAAKKAAKAACNRYTPLLNMLLNKGQLPSGWQDEDLEYAMLYNLQLDFQQQWAVKKMKRERKKKGDVEESLSVDDVEAAASGVAAPPVPAEEAEEAAPMMPDEEDVPPSASGDDSDDEEEAEGDEDVAVVWGVGGCVRVRPGGRVEKRAFQKKMVPRRRPVAGATGCALCTCSLPAGRNTTISGVAQAMSMRSGVAWPRRMCESAVLQAAWSPV